MDRERIDDGGIYALALWLTPLALFALFGGMAFLSQFIPPPSPAMSPTEVAEMYAVRSAGIKLTGMLTIFTPALLTPMTAVISVLMWRSEGRNAPLAITQIIAGVLTIGPFILSGLCWVVAAYRPERDPNSIMLMNDLGWISLEMVTPPAMIQFCCVAIAILRDKSGVPFMPRWVAFFSFWCAVLFVPGLFVAFFVNGPFAWNGILSFWVAAAAYGSWLLVMAWQCMKTVQRG
jgi:hypothetical protein